MRKSNKAPHFIERVLDWSSRQDKAVLCNNHFDRFCIAGAAVLNMLRFIEDHIAKCDLFYNAQRLFGAGCTK